MVTTRMVSASTRRVLVALCLVAVACVPLAAWAQPAPAPRPSWAVQPPERFGFDTEALDRAFEHAEDNLSPLNSLLIMRRDTLVAEAYFRGMRPGQQVNIKSASKSVLSALVGIALEEGAIDSLTQPIAPYFPVYFTRDDVAPLKRTITVRDLLMMQAGLESTSFGNYGPWVASDDWVTYALRQPLESPPGDDMIYSTGTTHLLSALLTEATGMSALRYAQTRLFEPLGIRFTRWQTDPQGIYFGGNNMALAPDELLRFGQLYLNNGQYRGRQIVPADWVDASTRGYTDETYRNFEYGYLWWSETFGGVRASFAWGYGGQYVFIIPSLDLVVACTSSLSRSRSRGHNGRIYNLLAEYIIPAVVQ